MKKIYNAPQVEIVKTNMVDVIAASNCPYDITCSSDFEDLGGECTANECTFNFA